jgi:hypothetical protein
LSDKAPHSEEHERVTIKCKLCNPIASETENDHADDGLDKSEDQEKKGLHKDMIFRSHFGGSNPRSDVVGVENEVSIRSRGFVLFKTSTRRYYNKMRAGQGKREGKEMRYKSR